MTYECLEDPNGHDCPFEPTTGEVRRDAHLPTSRPGGPWQLFLTDGEGTWHEVSAMRLVALTTAEVQDLDDGDEGVLDRCLGLQLIDVMEAHLPMDDRVQWT